MNMTFKPEIKKPMIMMLVVLGVLFGVIFLYKGVTSILLKRFFASKQAPTMTVSTTKIAYLPWQPTIKASGSTRAVTGVTVTAQLPGMIKTIYFTPGALVQKGTVLVQQNADPDIAQLHVLQANAELAKLTYQRDQAQYKIHAVSKQQLDTDEQNLKSTQAQVEQQTATVTMKTIAA